MYQYKVRISLVILVKIEKKSHLGEMERGVKCPLEVVEVGTSSLREFNLGVLGTEWQLLLGGVGDLVGNSPEGEGGGGLTASEGLWGRGDKERLYCERCADTANWFPVGGRDSSLDTLDETEVMGLGDLGTLTFICKAEVDTVSNRGAWFSAITDFISCWTLTTD